MEYRRLPLLAGLLILALLVAPGCMTLFVQTGERPRTELLDDALEIGRTRTSHVLEVLGPPQGMGRGMLPMHSKPRTVWAYYYQEGTARSLRRALLYVFFDGEIYDGYIWFSSLGD